MKITLISEEGQRLLLSCNENEDPKQVSDDWLDKHPDYKMYNYKIEDVTYEA